MVQSIPDWLEDLLDTVNGNPDPSSILGYTTDPTNMADVLTMEDVNIFLCHSVREHVLYYEEDADGKKRYECLECPW